MPGAGATARRECPCGDAVVWADLVVLVRRCMRSITGPTRDLEDLTQSALTRLVRALGPERRRPADTQLSTLAYRVCISVARNHWRAWRRFVRWFDVGVGDRDASTEDPHADVAATARAERLHLLVDRLSPDRRIVLRLCDLEELPAPQVAEILGCPEATVRSRLRQARLELSARVLADPWFRVEIDRTTSAERRGDRAVDEGGTS